MKKPSQIYLKCIRISFLLLITLLCMMNNIAVGQEAVWTRSYNNMRTGATLKETILTTKNVNTESFAKLFSRQVEGHIYAQPLYVPKLTMKSTGKSHNVIFVATQGNNVYAFDADDSARTDPLWMKSFGTPYPTELNLVGQSCGSFQDIQFEIGITGTPVIDLDSKTMFFVTLNMESGNTLKYYLRSVDITSGDEKKSVLVEGQVNGNGDGSENGVLAFDASKHIQRTSLTLLNGVVYFSFAGYCMSPPYHGWIFGYSTSLDRRLIFCDSPNTSQGGIWQGGAAFATDSSHLYISTGQGPFNPADGSYGNSFLKLDANGVVGSYFSPFDNTQMTAEDMDLGTTGALLIPDSVCMLGCAKGGNCYLVNKNNMGGHSSDSNQIMQYFRPHPTSSNVFFYGYHFTPIYWKSANKGELVYLWGPNDSIRALHLNRNGNTCSFQLDQTEVGSIDLVDGYPGGMLTISSDGEKDGIVWAAHPEGNSIHSIQPGVLRALNAENIKEELWNSKMVDGDSVGSFAKFNAPTVANGKVYLPTFGETRSAQLHVYGLTKQPPSPSSSNNPASSLDYETESASHRASAAWTLTILVLSCLVAFIVIQM